MISRNCKICNKNFITKNNRQLCCSKACSAKNHKIARDRYNHSDKGKVSKTLYAKSPRGKAVIKLKRQRYEKTIQAKINVKKYKSSDKGRAANRFFSAKRRIEIQQATPLWNDEVKTKKVYELASKIEKYLNKNNTGKYAKVHVDHIIPLKGKTFEGGYPVSGLNVWYNLMPSLDSDNVKKLNLCPPEKQLKGVTTPHLSLDKLPHPKIWIKFIQAMYKNAIKSSYDENFKTKMVKNYIEINPRYLKN